MPAASVKTINKFVKLVRLRVRTDHSILLYIAHSVLTDNFNRGNGVYRRKERDYLITEEEDAALQYLCEEWDYAYESK